MRIVITGASGNVGSALLRRLTRSDEHQVVGLVRRPPTDAGAPFDRVEWRAVDLTEDSCEQVLVEAFTGADAVVHLAWGFQPSHRLDYLAKLGIGGTAHVLAAAAAHVPHLVHMSSVGAYSHKRDDTPVTEDYPTEGVPGSPYSQHKAAAERLVDAFEREHPHTTVTRIRPGIVGQGNAGSALLRYGIPALVPASVVKLLPVLPVDRKLAIPMVHADDVADAIARAVEGAVPGAFNLAADPVITVDLIAAALGARHVQVPAAAVRAAVALSWHARVQQLDPGWIDLAFGIPLMDTSRARSELGWTPSHDAAATLRETVDGLTSAAHDHTPVLRPRTVVEELGTWVTRGAVSRRRRP